MDEVTRLFGRAITLTLPAAFATAASAANHDELNFTDWTSALGIQRVRDQILDRPGVVHLISGDIYLDIIFTEWSSGPDGGGGGFAYLRSTVVPVPAAAWLLGSALGVPGLLRRRLGG